MQLSDFDFELPEALIAQHPPAERGGSRLLHVDGSRLSARTISGQIASPRPEPLRTIAEAPAQPGIMWAWTGRGCAMMGRFVFGAAALLMAASSPAAAERPWRPGGYMGDRRCTAMLQWASLESTQTAAERASLRSVMLVACRPAGAAPPAPPPKAHPPPTRFIQVRWGADVRRLRA